MAVAGIKKVLSGSLNEITNSFSFSTSTIKAQSQLYVAGQTTVAGMSFQVTNPALDSTNTQIIFPSQDFCGGQTCQMNLIAMKTPPITNNSAKIVASTMSITFDKRQILNEN
jgi:Flp pilus assembly protein TadG